MNWEPIETAPRDRPILLWWPRYTYEADDDCGPVMAMGQWKNNPRTGKSYFADTDELDDYGMSNNPPSHWMPLPDPPNTELTLRVEREARNEGSRPELDG